MHFPLPSLDASPPSLTLPSFPHFHSTFKRNSPGTVCVLFNLNIRARTNTFLFAPILSSSCVDVDRSGDQLIERKHWAATAFVHLCA